MSRRPSSEPISRTSSGIQNFRSRRRGSGSTSSSTGEQILPITTGTGTPDMKSKLASTRLVRFGTGRCGFQWRRSTRAQPGSAIECGSISIGCKGRLPTGHTLPGNPRTSQPITRQRRSGRCDWSVEPVCWRESMGRSRVSLTAVTFGQGDTGGNERRLYRKRACAVSSRCRRGVWSGCRIGDTEDDHPPGFNQFD